MTLEYAAALSAKPIVNTFDNVSDSWVRPLIGSP